MRQRQAVTDTIATRYKQAGRGEKGMILDELCATTGWHRNHARKALACGADAPGGPSAGGAGTEVWPGSRCGAEVLLGGAGGPDG